MDRKRPTRDPQLQRKRLNRQIFFSGNSVLELSSTIMNRNGCVQQGTATARIPHYRKPHGDSMYRGGKLHTRMIMSKKNRVSDVGISLTVPYGGIERTTPSVMSAEEIVSSRARRRIFFSHRGSCRHLPAHRNFIRQRRSRMWLMGHIDLKECGQIHLNHHLQILYCKPRGVYTILSCTHTVQFVSAKLARTDGSYLPKFHSTLLCVRTTSCCRIHSVGPATAFVSPPPYPGLLMLISASCISFLPFLSS